MFRARVDVKLRSRPPGSKRSPCESVYISPYAGYYAGMRGPGDGSRYCRVLVHQGYEERQMINISRHHPSTPVPDFLGRTGKAHSHHMKLLWAEEKEMTLDTQQRGCLTTDLFTQICPVIPLLS
ncbi:hypothetical protein DPEC_G00199830 [Dallia pectoralis]|uniref:Uncharacterized protein n=1 Tax=Dallia pectoralis TaxID=75939 RepID=A0ACC2G8K9_DALPE|nr:hypothetical protein DPEC_G00199830 [Dallia pectoralis]